MKMSKKIQTSCTNDVYLSMTLQYPTPQNGSHHSLILYQVPEAIGYKLRSNCKQSQYRRMLASLEHLYPNSSGSQIDPGPCPSRNDSWIIVIHTIHLLLLKVGQLVFCNDLSPSNNTVLISYTMPSFSQTLKQRTIIEVCDQDSATKRFSPISPLDLGIKCKNLQTNKEGVNGWIFYIKAILLNH